MARVFLLLACAAVAVSGEIREKRQWFGGAWGGWPASTHTVVQPTVHTTSVQQPVVTQEVQQHMLQTVTAAPIVQNHEHVVDTPVFKHVQHTVGVPTPVVDPVIVTPRVIVPKPSVTKISVIQRAKRQWFGNFGWGASAFVQPSTHTMVQPTVHTTSVQQPVVTQEVQQHMLQTVTAAPVVQNHVHTVDTPVFQHVQHTVAVPTPVVDPVVVVPKVIVPKPSVTKISVIQRAKRQFWGDAAWGVAPTAFAAAAPVAAVATVAPAAVAVAAPVNTVTVAPTQHVHTNIVNPPLVQQVVRPVVHTQVVQPVVHTQSTVLRPVVHELHHNVYVPEYIHIKPTIIEPEIVEPEADNTKVSVIQRAKRQALLGAYPGFGGYYGAAAYPYGAAPFGYPYTMPVAAFPAVPKNTKISIIQAGH